MRVRGRRSPVILGVAGDSASGKSTLTRGLVDALGPKRCVVISADDYACVDILSQHLQLLATGQPILKPESVEPAEFVIVEGRLALHSRLTRACFHVTVFLESTADMHAQSFIRRQRDYADIVVRFADGRDHTSSATVLMRPTIRQPDLTSLLCPEDTRTVRRRAERDSDGRLVDSLHVQGLTGGPLAVTQMLLLSAMYDAA